MITMEPTGMKNGSMRVTTSVLAEGLIPGHAVTNIGRVVSVRSVGAFIVVMLEGQEWSLTNGMARAAFQDVVYHQADEVTVDVPQ